MATSTKASVPTFYPIQPTQLPAHPPNMNADILQNDSSTDLSSDDNKSDSTDDPLYNHYQCNMSQNSDISILQDQVRELDLWVHAAESQVCTAEAHCTMVLSEVDTMKKKLHLCAGKKKTWALDINACWLTSAKGLNECEEQETAKETAWKKEEVKECAAARKAV
ncbi:hypothetical protein C8R48DRAFT_670410 [Suillus tomentosus]|nr:hypothetical protein C8R48DRAFT_670410 [Suillus tomentosus]